MTAPSSGRDPLDILRETDPEAAERVTEMLRHAIKAEPIDWSQMQFTPAPSPAGPERETVEARFVSSAQEMLGRDFVEAILADVFQGKRDHLRDHMLSVVAKVTRKHPWPYFDECVEARVAAAVETAWDEGWERARESAWSTPSDNPYRADALRAATEADHTDQESR